MSKGQLERLKASIEKYGFIVPIITNKDLLIADGEQRWNVAKQLNMTQVPVIRLPVEDVDRRLLRQVLNKLRGEHELIADALEFERIITAGHEEELKHLLDLSDSQLERYLSEIHEPNPEDYAVPEIDKIKTDIQRGDIYVLRNHRLMCGDATNKEDVEALMNGQKADMVFTDPPYNVDYGSLGSVHFSLERAKAKNDMRRYRQLIEIKKRFPAGKIIGDNLSSEEWLSFCVNTSEIIKENVNSAVYICTAPGPDGDLFRLVLSEVFGHWSATIIWNKQTMALGRADFQRQYEPIWYGWCEGKNHFVTDDRTLTDVWDIPKPTKNEFHPTQKPVELPKKAILNSSIKENIVLDLFGGSGSTLIACQQTGRTCYMMEIDPRYCQVIINRWEAYTHQKAIKTNSPKIGVT